MTPIFHHIPVLLRPVLEMVGQVVAAAGPGPVWWVDSTLGGAGHSTALLEAFPTLHLLGIDRDPAAIATARARLQPFGARARIVQARFSELQDVVAEADLGLVHGVLADFGVSSHQLDTAERGFSFQTAAPLDMRMNPGEGETAAELLQRIDAGELAVAIKTLGEERFARRVARAIVEVRPTTTDALAQTIRRVVPRSKDGIDPATRTFQAVRMLVNQELDEIHTWLAALPHVLADNGVAMAISFHSLEDRAVKVALRSHARGCVCPPNLPMCACGQRPTFKLLTPKAVQADARELADNIRARSARLRAARRLVRHP